jgi:15,16-dihydrobiliverdin:ferredoxin oxidoreductase
MVESRMFSHDRWLVVVVVVIVVTFCLIFPRGEQSSLHRIASHCITSIEKNFPFHSRWIKNMKRLLISLSVWILSFPSQVQRRNIGGCSIIGFSHALSMWRNSKHGKISSLKSRANFLSMDAGEESLFLRPNSSTPNKRAMQKLNSFTFWNHHHHHQQQQQQQQRHNHILRSTQEKIGMPWTESIVSTQDLTFMPFWNHQISFMQDHLMDLQASPTTNKAGTRDFSLTNARDVRVANLCFSSSHFRKIRLTYYDAGPQGQVFNSLWYPALEYDLPILGIDLLQFNAGKKHLTVIDFQPIHEQHFRPFASAHPTYEHALANIRKQYPILQGKMSSRFYDESQFFSQHVLFARFTDSNVVREDLWSAFQQCLVAYVTMAHNTPPKSEQTNYLRDRQKAYDVYSANRDPAHAMFKAKFGESWANEFVYEFLFEWSREEFTRT